MGKLTKVLKAIGRFINQAIIDMTDDRPSGGMAARHPRRLGCQAACWVCRRWPQAVSSS